MNRFERLIQKIPLGENKSIEVVLRYDIGGMNYFQGMVQARGYYLGATPVTRYPNGDSEFTAFSGTKALVLEAKRFSAKVLAALQPDLELQQKLVNNVIVKNKIVLPERIS